MKLTKLQRHTAYIILLYEYETLKFRWLCGTFHSVTDIELDPDFRFTNFKLMLPELWRKRQKGTDEHSLFLFESYEHRVAALKQCISETA